MIETKPQFSLPLLIRATFILAVLALGACAAEDRATSKPNIIFIMSDDQGYGQAGSYNPTCGIETPGIDRIAREGMRFTDAHSASAVCSPTRYALLTGRYNWRTRLQKGVLRTGDAPLIAEDTLTVQGFLKQNGYRTACFGKWHLGFDYRMPEGAQMDNPGRFKAAAAVGSKVIDGPIARDFDVFHGYHHAREMRTWIEQDTVTENLESPERMLPRITASSVAYIRERGAKKDGPFFLYVPLNSPHTPIVPSPEWVGKSGLGHYSDFVMQTDHAVVEILNAIDEAGLTDRTIVFFTTDNGTAPNGASVKTTPAGEYDPLGGLRGHKADVWEGGHRVPYLVRWPGVIDPGSISNETICHNNLLATCADILGTALPDNAGVDSFSIFSLLRNETTTAPTHPYVIHHSISGHFAIRQGKWKLLACRGSGGWSKGDDGQPAQLYDLSSDRDEENNLIESNPKIAKELADLLETAVANGRSRPGPPQKNDVPVDIWKTKAGRPDLLN
jgi:arylsulfatase A